MRGPEDNDNKEEPVETTEPTIEPTPEPESKTPDEDVKDEGKEPEPEKPTPKRRGPNKAKKAETPEPAIGRIVLYVTAQFTIRPAIIASAEEAGEVELVVFNSGGAGFVPRAIFAPAESEIPGTYHWPEAD